MGSAAGAVTEAVDALNATGARVGVAVVRLFRPFPTAQLLAALPSVRTIAVLDRTKEPGAPFEPLHQDVLAALWHSDAAHWADGVRPRLIGGRYGLSSKEFTPAMAKAVFDEAATDDPLNGFTVGIIDDVTRLSLDVDPSFTTDTSKVRAVFYGLGSDGTVGANKNTAKIVGSHTDLHVQGYFVYDSKKSGSMTVSHLRFDDRPIESTYLIDQATFVGVHQWNFLQRMDVLKLAAEGAVVLINSPHRPEDVWAALPEEAQQQVLDRHLRLYTIDAAAVAKAAGLGGRVNTVMQTCFFALAGVLPTEQAIAALKDAIEHTYGKRGSVIVERNVAAVDTTLANLHEVPVGAAADSGVHRRAVVPPGSSDFVQRVTARMLAGEGDLLPVSALPPDGMFPTGTAKVEAPHDRAGDPDLGTRPLHRLRQVRDRLPARRDPAEGVRGRRPAIRRDAEDQELPIPRGARAEPHRAGGARRLHRLRPVRGGVPGARQERGEAQEHQPAADRRAPRHRTGRVGRVPRGPGRRRHPVRPGVGEDQPVAHPAVRVQRCVLGLRRDAVPEAAHPALR
ncbi:MAG: 2-oxoacid:acceptor oxidoreductase family protein [Ilumatobacteraceae bacterium]